LQDFLGSSFQAKWFTSLSNGLLHDIKDSSLQSNIVIDPKVFIDSLIQLLREESQEQGKPLNETFYETLEELKDDADFIKVFQELDEGLRGERNILTIGMYSIYHTLIILRGSSIESKW